MVSCSHRRTHSVSSLKIKVTTGILIFATFFSYSFCQLFTEDDESFCLTKDTPPEQGVCINLKTKLKLCSPLYSLLKSGKWEELKSTFCETNVKHHQKVCCPIEDFEEVLNSTDIDAIDLSTHKNFHLFPSNCGQTFLSDRIIGGETANPGDNPWMVRLGLVHEETETENLGCSGTVINKRYILSAAHCLKEESFKLKFVRLAETDEETDLECIVDSQTNKKIACTEAQNVGIDKVIIHPGYNREVGSPDDIALIRVNEDLNITSYFIRPICLPFVKEYNIKGNIEDTLSGVEVLESGWGKVNADEQIGSSTLQFVKVPLLPNIKCRSAYRNHDISNSQICAGGVKDKGSCQGDSGGPLSITALPEKKTPRQFQIGIVSYGRAKCGKGDAPVVYTRVRKYLKWILDNTQE